MRDYTKIIQPGEAMDYPVMGNNVRLDDETLIKVTATVTQANNQGIIGNFTTLRGGDSARFASDFLVVSVSHNEGTPQAITLMMGYGDKASSRVSGSVQATIVQGKTLTDAAASVGIAAAAVTAVDSARKAIHFRNLSANNIYLGGPLVTAANAGIMLIPGEEHREEAAAAAAWFAIADGAASALAMTVIS